MTCACLLAGALAAVTLFVGVIHFFLCLRRPNSRQDCAFAVLCLLVAVYDLFCVGLYASASPREGVAWQRLQSLVLALGSVALLQFLAEYTGRKSRRFPLALGVVFIAIAVLGLLDLPGLRWHLDRPAVKELQLPWLGGITYQEMTAGPLFGLQSLAGLAIFPYGFWAGAQLYRTNRRKALPLLVALGVFFLSVANDGAVANGYYRFVYTIEYGFLALILITTYAVSNDVLRAALMEQALRESEQKFRRLYESERDGLVVADLKDGKLFMPNSAFCRLTGYTQAELEAMTFEMLHPPEVKEAARRHFAQLAESGVAPLNEVPLLRKDGVIVTVEIADVPIQLQGRDCLLGSFRDITARKRQADELRRLNENLEGLVRERTARLEELNKELESFSVSVSHDLRAPLRTLEGFARVLEEDLAGKLEPASLDHLERMRHAARRMDQLIADLLRLSRVTRSELRREELDLTELAEQLLKALAAAHPERRVEWQVARGLRASADRQLLSIALDNLLQNAWKFTSQVAEARVEVGMARKGEEEVFYVRDNGAGFDMAQSQRLFAPFQRLHTEEEFEGTGIGLATVNRVVRRHGGRIWTEAEVGRGATFFFTLPPSRRSSGRF